MRTVASRWLGLALLLCVGAFAADAATLRVRPGDNLQAVLNAARAGDTIEVERGRYVGNFVIDKPLVLRGLDRPTLSGGLRGDTLRIKATDVVIEGLIVTESGDSLRLQNAGIYLERGAHRVVVRDNELTYNLFGLWVEEANDVRIERNVITGKRDYMSSQRGNGVQLYNTRGAHVIGNRISFVRDALYVDVTHHAVFRGNRLHHSRYGTHYMNSHHNLWEDNDSWANRGGLALMEVRNQIVRNNRTWGNSDHGIMLRTLQDSVIENNIVAGNGRGFFIYDVEYATLRGNLIIDNHVGVHLAALSTRNVVEGNDFVANRKQVRYLGTRDERWGGTPGAGNFFSNYLGWDRDGDGVGDLPYEANDLVDRLLWRHPMARILLASPAVQTLRVVERQFPVLRSPSVVDPYPAMQPHHDDWRPWFGRHFR